MMIPDAPNYIAKEPKRGESFACSHLGPLTTLYEHTKLSMDDVRSLDYKKTTVRE